MVKNLPANSGDARDVSLIPGLGWSPGEGHGNPFQCSYLENSMDRGAWQVTVHGTTKSQTWLIRYTHTHTHTHSGYRHLLFFCFAFPSTQVPPPGLNSQLELSHYICIPAQEGKRRKAPTPPFEGISWESHTKLLIIFHLPEISQWIVLHRKLRIIIFILGNEIPA